jgi:hypothetical protein
MVGDESRHSVEQSFAAVRELALGSGMLSERLEGACDALLTLESAQLPELIREEFKALIADIMAIDEFTDLAETATGALALRILVFHERVILSSKPAAQP